MAVKCFQSSSFFQVFQRVDIHVVAVQRIVTDKPRDREKETRLRPFLNLSFRG